MEKKKSVDEMTNDAIADGGYLVNLYFDLHAATADEVKNLMVGFISKLTKEKGVIYAVGEIDEPLEKGGVYSTWAEVKLLAEDFNALARIAAQYSPIGVDILRPERVVLDLGSAQGLLLDIANTSQNFTRMIMERVLSKEEIENYRKKMDARTEIGKKLLEGQRKKP
ncbi:MAG: hypothetical protein WCT52_04855 [Candidatus Micrarchaeia archaeon]